MYDPFPILFLMKKKNRKQANEHIGIMLLLIGVERLKEGTQPSTKRHEVAQLEM